MKSRAMSVSMTLAMRSVPGIWVAPKGAALLSGLPTKDAPMRTMRPLSAASGTRPATRSAKEYVANVPRGPR